MPILAAELASLLGTVRRPGDFFAAGTAELLTPSLEIEGVGPVALPLLPEQAGRIIGVAEAAPYGRGEDTVVDPAVRRCWQVGPDRVRLGGRHWARTLDRIVAQVAEGLGVADPVTAEFHKLLVYGPGSFFVGHRDTEKAPGMFATLVIVLPSSFEGGDLLVRHRGREARLALRCGDPAEAAFAAFYADCVHEVLPVTAGHRLPWPTTWCGPARAARPSLPTTRHSKAASRRCCRAGGTGGRSPMARCRRSWSIRWTTPTRRLNSGSPR
jgi:predicted 2-oxoglutarate/Fe(II)-dependent dioxygenase YbiX